MDEILQEFLSETAETMEAIGGEIVAWEADPADRDRLDTIFRFVHTVKGSCGFLDLPRIGALSHAAEDALDAARQGTRKPTPGLVGAVLAVIDRILELTEVIGETGNEPVGDDRALIDVVQRDDAAAIGETRVVPQPEATPDAALSSQHWRTIRVPLHLLDSMMNGVSDMVLARNEVARILRGGSDGNALSSAFDRLSTSVGDMRNAVGQMRMQRIEKLFAPLPRLVRDLGRELGKSVEVVIEGGEVELDREMIESIRDPLTHIIRNAVDHGIEDPATRLAAGKPESGTLIVSARQSGNQITIEVRDDGAGIALERIVAKAVAAKVVSAAKARALSPEDRLQLIFSPGLSTADAVTAVSGRGVGMDVVRSNIQRIGGVVDLDNHEGEGLAITVRVPLTLTIISGLTVAAGGQMFAIPRASVSEIILQASGAVKIDEAGGANVAIVRGDRLSLVHLEDVLGVARCDTDSADRTIVITRGIGGHSYALSVADVFDHEELVIKPAAPAIMATGLYAGTTLPDNGRPMLLLDTNGIAERAGVSDSVEDHKIGDELLDTGEAHAEQVLLFRDFDDVVRAIRLAVVDRVDDLRVEAISRSGGRLRALIDDRLVSMYDADPPESRASIKLLRLSDGDSEAGYGIAEVLDVTRLTGAVEPPAAPGLIGGVVLIDGEPVEIVDPFWVFASLAGATGYTNRPVCRLADADDHWTRQFLAPLVEAAGYRVVLAAEGDDSDVVVAGTGSDTVPQSDRVVRLRKHAGAQGDSGDTIYRYDQRAILAALARITGGRAA